MPALLCLRLRPAPGAASSAAVAAGAAEADGCRRRRSGPGWARTPDVDAWKSSPFRTRTPQPAGLEALAATPGPARADSVGLTASRCSRARSGRGAPRRRRRPRHGHACSCAWQHVRAAQVIARGELVGERRSSPADGEVTGVPCGACPRPSDRRSARARLSDLAAGEVVRRSAVRFAPAVRAATSFAVRPTWAA